MLSEKMGSAINCLSYSSRMAVTSVEGELILSTPSTGYVPTSFTWSRHVNMDHKQIKLF